MREFKIQTERVRWKVTLLIAVAGIALLVLSPEETNTKYSEYSYQPNTEY